ncbi:MAG TPA: IS110 family transposase [Methyloceanibacter sp.]|nr:IS110 family transposase [Methyloceanibacter sp.]
MRKPKQHKPLNDLSRSLTPFDPNQTLTVVIELSLKTWLVAGIIPGVERQPLKKLEPDEHALLKLFDRWRKEAEKAGHKIKRITVAFEVGRDGFWLARWLRSHGIEAHVIHAASIAVSREHRRAKTDRLDTELLKRTFLGWLRGERDHCKMVAIPTLAEEDAKRPNREHEALVGERTCIINRMKATLTRLGIRNFNPKLKKAAERLEHVRTPEGEPIPPNTLAELHRDMQRRQLVMEQIRQIEKARLERLQQAPKHGANVMVLLLARVIGIGIETADLLVQEVLSRNLRDQRALARYSGLTGSPDESGTKRREKGLARSGNARVRRGMVQLAWRFLEFQKDSALAKWFRARTENARGSRKKMIVALARKLLIALWHFVRNGVVPEGIMLRPAQ